MSAGDFFSGFGLGIVTGLAAGAAGGVIAAIISFAAVVFCLIGLIAHLRAKPERKT